MICDWLRMKYPQAKVGLEYSIKETNQIADVFVEFGGNIRFAFEIQCAPLTEETWLERYYLYKKAKIQSIWLFGSYYYKLIESENNEESEMCLKLKNLQQRY